jgi:acyl-CoA synthetase (NDP forming)
MDMERWLQKAQQNGRAILPENEGKDLLRQYDIPVVTEKPVQNAKEAVEAARQMGYPVVLKGMSQSILHKTEHELVQLNLNNADDIEHAMRSMQAKAGSSLQQFLLQPQIKGQREMVAGLVKDPQFGPAVMFGIGGIFTEALSDVAFRLAPLNENDAREMLQEIRANHLLGAIRGEQAADRDQLVRVLLGLSRLSVEYPQVSEIDINPLIITRQGDVCAVDALVIITKSQAAGPSLAPVSPEAIRALFYPRSIAYIGASAQLGKWGHTLVANTISGGYQGDIFLVNPKGGEIAGRTVYPAIEAVPAEVDLGVVTIPADKVTDLIPQFKAKGISNMLLITSGFGETGANGKTLESNLVKAAQNADVLILGPNTMGICNPHINFYCTGSPVKPSAGSTAMVAQSGNMGIQLLAFAEQQGIGIRAFCGSGNEAMLTIEDFLEGFEVDALTRTVMLYIESVKNGRRFFESARRLGKKKPIVLLKGGRTAAGNRAAASHTGAMAADTVIFDALCRQAGVVQVDRPMEMLDLAAAFSSLPLPRGNRVAIMTMGGGWGVVTADLCEEFNLVLPELSAEIVTKFNQRLPVFWSRANPIDLVGERDPDLPMFVLEELVGWQGCDAVLKLGVLGRRMMVKKFGESVLKADPTYAKDFIAQINQHFLNFEDQYIRHVVALMKKFDKPIIGVSILPDEENKTVYRISGSEYKGVFYPTPERAVKTIAKMVQYRKFISRDDV